MSIWKLWQNQYRDNCERYADIMIVRASNEDEARVMAKVNEDTEREGELNWDPKNATCELIPEDGKSDIILVK